MKKVCVYTATRAEYCLLYPVIKKIQLDPDLQLDLIVSGAHLSEKYGYTCRDIIDDGFKINAQISILDEEKNDIDQAIALSITGCSKYLKESKPDILLVLGDRYEILGPVIAASNLHIPIAHIHGGETTEGAIDEAIRHAVTKFSYLHFTCCEEYRERVIQLGEDPKRVYNVGGLGVENILTQNLMSKEELAENLNFNLNQFCLVTFHPVTLEDQTAEEQVDILMKALLKKEGYTFIITKANADFGGNGINKILDTYSDLYPDKFKVVYSLGLIRYLSAMKYCKLVIGNSSSGILEAPTFCVPTINIGDRQKGRIQCKSIINCEPTDKQISEAIELGLDMQFRDSIKDLKSPYGEGKTSELIIKYIKQWLEEGIDLKKKFFDIDITHGGSTCR